MSEQAIMRAAGGDRWLAQALRQAIGLVRDGRGWQLVAMPGGARWAACYIVETYRLTP